MSPSSLLTNNGIATVSPGQYITVPRFDTEIVAPPPLPVSVQNAQQYFAARTPAYTAAQIRAASELPSNNARREIRDTLMPSFTNTSLGGPTASTPNYAAWAQQAQTREKMNMITYAMNETVLTGQLDLARLPTFVTLSEMTQNNLTADTMMQLGMEYNPETRRWENPYSAGQAGGGGGSFLDNPNIRNTTRTALQRQENRERRNRYSWTNRNKRGQRQDAETAAFNQSQSQVVEQPQVSAPTITAPNIQTILWRTGG